MLSSLSYRDTNPKKDMREELAHSSVLAQCLAKQCVVPAIQVY